MPRSQLLPIIVPQFVPGFKRTVSLFGPREANGAVQEQLREDKPSGVRSHGEGWRLKMTAVGRREFIAGSLLGGAALLAAGVRAQVARGAEARVEVLIDEPIGTILPDIYGHFTEHLGGVVYDGIWVGENSKIPNVGGIRTALVENLRRIKAPVIRWPGGCFADSYNWHDGVGPRSQRPRRTNFWVDSPEWRNAPDGPWKYDPNQFGTNEFARFCKLSGAQPYFAANLRSLPAKDTYEWVEYCNSPAGSTSLAELRAAGGEREPFKVRFWGVGVNVGIEEWYELSRQGDTREPLINSHWQAMAEIDRQYRVKLIVDEWGA